MLSVSLNKWRMIDLREAKFHLGLDDCVTNQGIAKQTFRPNFPTNLSSRPLYNMGTNLGDVSPTP